MAAPIPEDIKLYLSQIKPDITKTLMKEFSHLSEKAIYDITKQVLTAALHIRNVSTNQRLKLAAFVRQLVREQVQIWLAVYGTSMQQTKATSQILDENQATVRHFLKSHTFKTTDIADDILNESFRTFFEIIESGKPVVSTISTMVKGIARKKVLKQLSKDKMHPWLWLETIYESNGDDTIGTFDYPIVAEEDEPQAVILHLPNIVKGLDSDKDPKDFIIRVDFKQLQSAIADCFSELKEPRQLLLRIINTFWKGYKEGPLSQDQILSSYEKLSMEQVAGMTDYKDAHTVSVRLTETNKMLRKCLTNKLNLTNSGQ